MGGEAVNRGMGGEAVNRETANREARPLLVFDGDCGFCTRSAQWIQRKLPDEARVEPWQALDLDELGLTVADVTGAAWWVSPDQSQPARGHEAIGRALVAAGGVWGIVGRLIVGRPGRWLARPVYAVIARNRHRMPGGAPACQTGAEDSPAAAPAGTPATTTNDSLTAAAGTLATTTGTSPAAAPAGTSASAGGEAGASLTDRR